MSAHLPKFCNKSPPSPSPNSRCQTWKHMPSSWACAIEWTSWAVPWNSGKWGLFCQTQAGSAKVVFLHSLLHCTVSLTLLTSFFWLFRWAKEEHCDFSGTSAESCAVPIGWMYSLHCAGGAACAPGPWLSCCLWQAPAPAWHWQLCPR